ncbi:hypothetical protein M438DRAFT_93468 [Aureobasidium pullulans EXF-150]|uniref:Zn(2)-C6 fungal-type domain-containing protein n=1 Tax=Aureobasidium pullulans EXF-150 TaxID=1043002 RepID=A0A074XYZ3_AURPU|nr:uncharacterized protein M438DRAFT_93468 [Aureobasidium pullulans EXF-150]KEQ88864.1 hypothetical protein M438DRAFT_93468 [Aureobasidium pullulans EXF-150]
MSHEDHQSFTPAVDPYLPNTISQLGNPSGDSTASPSRSLGSTRKRAPLASVACQDCRRRKTKCDGKKPACSNCTKRGVTACTYDLEPNQSRVAAYKQKIEQQAALIKALEEEIQMLKNPSSRTEATVGASEYETFQSSSKHSGGVPMRFLLNPAPEPNRLSSGHSVDGPGLPAPEPAPPPLAERIRRDAEHLDRVRTLEEEIHLMKQLMSFTNGLDDRDKANQMAREIEVHGISDPLLHEAQHLFASQVRRSPLANLQNKAKAEYQQSPGRAAESSRPIP